MDVKTTSYPSAIKNVSRGCHGSQALKNFLILHLLHVRCGRLTEACTKIKLGRDVRELSFSAYVIQQIRFSFLRTNNYYFFHISV